MTSAEMFKEVLEILQRIEKRQIEGLSGIRDIKETVPPVEGGFGTVDYGKPK